MKQPIRISTNQQVLYLALGILLLFCLVFKVLFTYLFAALFILYVFYLNKIKREKAQRDSFKGDAERLVDETPVEYTAQELLDIGGDKNKPKGRKKRK